MPIKARPSISSRLTRRRAASATLSTGPAWWLFATPFAGNEKVVAIDEAATVDQGPCRAPTHGSTRDLGRYGIYIAELEEIDDHLAVTGLLSRIWRTQPGWVVGADLLRAFAHSGNYVVGAYLDGRLVGASVAFYGDGHLHSHLTGVDPTLQGRGIGYAIKQHQRSWAAARGIREIRWMFDPLVRVHAHFNINKLGAVPTAYLPSFYGSMTDGPNSGDESDRLHVVWDVTGSPTVAAAVAAAGADPRPLLVPVRGRPVLTEQPGDGTAMLVAIPPDIDRIRREDPALAMAWRRALRDALTHALADGYRIVALRRDGCYVVELPCVT